jgi:hypothetical protein
MIDLRKYRAGLLITAALTLAAAVRDLAGLAP